jgi:hypothetical protein
MSVFHRFCRETAAEPVMFLSGITGDIYSEYGKRIAERENQTR